MRCWSRTNSDRLIKRSHSLPLDMAGNEVDNFSVQGDNQALQNIHDQPRTLRDFMNPTKTEAASCIVFFS